jgi:hypothetical protein
MIWRSSDTLVLDFLVILPSTSLVPEWALLLFNVLVLGPKLEDGIAEDMLWLW